MEKKEALRRAAEKLFREKGFRRVSVRAISEAAGMSGSAVSYYFGSKEALYQELFPEAAGEHSAADARECIEAAAVRLFAADGYEKVSIRDIAREAHVNSAAISYYFGGKAELYKQVLYKGTSMISEFVRIVEEQAPPPEDILLIYGQFLCRLGREQPEVLRLIFWELMHGTAVFNEFVRQRLSQVFQILREAVETGMAEGRFRADLSPETVCVNWAGLVLFFFLTQGIQREIIDCAEMEPEVYLAQTWKVFLSGIKKE